jgi:hypothetical protein
MSDEENMQSRIDEIAGLIKAAVPNADKSLYGDPWSGFGSATWAPARDKNTDYSQWGRWEVWEHCRIGRIDEMTVGPIPTGTWVAWDSKANLCQVGNRDDMPSKRQAELMAAMSNKGRPTRIVHKDGSVESSAIETVEAQHWAARQAGR